MKRNHSSQRGAALLIALAFIVIISIVVVGMNLSMQIDRPAAASYFEKTRANLYAQEGVDRIVSQLREYTTDTNRNWISCPGQLVVGAATDDTSTAVDERKVLSTIVPLSSGKVDTNVVLSYTTLNPPNLNIATFRDPNSNLLTDLPDGSDPTVKTVMQVKWIYVRQSGAEDTSQTPAITTDPITGRYAYWTDDESSKVNYNIAWGRTSDNTNPDGHPTKIDLTALSGFTNMSTTDAHATASAIRSFVISGTATATGTDLMALPSAAKGYSFFNTPEDARRVTPNVATALQASKFEVTHYNHDPDTTFFNEPRIVLTTRPDRAGWTYNTNPSYPNKWVGVNNLPWPQGRPLYLHILANEGTKVQPNYIPTAPPSRSAASPATYPAPDPLDPGVLSNLSGPNTQSINAHYNTTDTLLMLALSPPPASWPAGFPIPAGFQQGYMQRTDWPMVTGTGSIQSKYFGAYPNVTTSNGANVRNDRLTQIALNIIEYVRAKESPQPVIAPIRTVRSFPKAPALPVVDPQSWLAYGIQYGGNSFLGLSRAPHITEMGVWLGQATAAIPATTLPYTLSVRLSQVAIKKDDWVKKFKVEIYLPNGASAIDLTQFSLFNLDDSNYYNIDPTEIFRNMGGHLVNDLTSTLLKPGEYVTIVESIYLSAPVASSNRGPRQCRFAIAGAYGLPANDPLQSPATAGAILDVAPLPYDTMKARGSYIGVPIDPQSTTEDNMHSAQVDDPQVNRHYLDWNTNSVNSFGTTNLISSLYAAQSPTVAADLPEQDTDSSGKISTASFYTPPPAGTSFTNAVTGAVDDNTKGMVQSVGELGYLPTGMESSPYAVDTTGVTNNVPAGVPWRTIRLQPNRYTDTTVVPDWAFMDLFTAPVYSADTNASYIYAPHGNSVGGRVNMNAHALPFGLQRPGPLAAVLQGASYDATQPAQVLDTATAQTTASNIYNSVLAPSGKQYGSVSCYDSPGEVVEMKGVADKGEKSEQLVRSISNLITARGNVFSIYTVGQALKQTPDGKLIVTGEQRFQSMIERYTDSSVTPSTIRFSPVYFRSLTP